MSPTSRTIMYLAALLGVGAFVYACGGGFAVGDVRERNVGERGAESVRNLRLDPVASFVSSDSRAPAWSPDSRKLVYTEQYQGRVQLYDLDSQASKSIYDSATGAGSGLADIQWNIDRPVFLNQSTVLSGPGYGPSVFNDEPWARLIATTIDGDTTSSAFPAQGSRPLVSPDGSMILLQGNDGMRLTDSEGSEKQTFNNLFDADWGPDSKRFVALRRQPYTYNQPGTLVLVDLEAESKEKELNSSAISPQFAPDGSGIAFIRTAGNNAYFNPLSDFGNLKFLDLEEGKTRNIAAGARQPSFSADPMFLFYSTARGLGVSDLNKSRIIEGISITDPNVSPDGSMLVGVEPPQTNEYGTYYNYGSIGIEIYAIGFD